MIISGIKDDKVRVIAVDSVTGEIINSKVQFSQSDSSSTGDSIDGNLPSEATTSSVKGFNTFQSLTLDNSGGSAALSDGNIYATAGYSGGNNVVSAVGDNAAHFSFLAQTPGHTDQVSSGGAVTVPQVIIVDSKEGSSLLGKRPGERLSENSLVNKIIITKNPHSSQSQAVPLQVQTIAVSQAAGTHLGISDLTQATKTPTKTITISQQGIISPAKGMTMAQVVGTPPKLPISKLPISPLKTPTKITMIPVSVAGRSPQRIAPAVMGQTLLNNSSTSNAQATITMSPSKVMKQPGTVHVVGLMAYTSID